MDSNNCKNTQNNQVTIAQGKQGLAAQCNANVTVWHIMIMTQMSKQI